MDWYDIVSNLIRNYKFFQMALCLTSSWLEMWLVLTIRCPHMFYLHYRRKLYYDYTDSAGQTNSIFPIRQSYVLALSSLLPGTILP